MQGFVSQRKILSAGFATHLPNLYSGDMQDGIKHIFWDWNGTLLDDTALIHSIVSGLMQARNLPLVSFETYRHKQRFPMVEFYKDLGFDMEKESFLDISREYIKVYEQHKFDCALHDGTVGLLNDLHSDGMRQSVLSAYLQETLTKTVSHFGVDKFFDVLAGHDSVAPTSKIEDGRKLINRLGLSGHEVLIIGDTLHDAEVAEALGLKCILVSYGQNPRERLMATGFPVADSVAELEKHIQRQ